MKKRSIDTSRGALAAVLVFVPTVASQNPPEAEAAAGVAVVEQLRVEAKALEGMVSTEVARRFLAGVGSLPEPSTRVVLYDSNARRYSAPHRREGSSGDVTAADLERRELEPATYYMTKYGSPLAYCRVVELAGRSGLESLEGRRVLDFGYGTIGHLRLMASCGADVVGVDVDSFLVALYSRPSDQGVVANPEGRDGRIRLVDGQWPAREDVRSACGGGYDLLISKNTLKRGYVHPEREVDPRRLVHLGVDDASFVRAMHDALSPGGLAIIYNLSPPQNPPDEPYLPWADGRCPFDRELLESTGFEVLAYDVDDGSAAREQGRRLGWDKSEEVGGAGMNLEGDLFAHYTVLKKKGSAISHQPSGGR